MVYCLQKYDFHLCNAILIKYMYIKLLALSNVYLIQCSCDDRCRLSISYIYTYFINGLNYKTRSEVLSQLNALFSYATVYEFVPLTAGSPPYLLQRTVYRPIAIS